jgi:integrase/recombinase XerD
MSMPIAAEALVPSIVPASTTDAEMIAMWLHRKPATTQRAYRSAVARFLPFVGVPLRLVTLRHFQDFLDDLDQAGLKPATQRRIISSVKSLLTSANKANYIPFNVGVMIAPPKLEDTLAERILSEKDVARLLALEPDPRNHALLCLLYRAGLRISEVAQLRWRHLVESGDAGQVTVLGKGQKTRHILLDTDTWAEVHALRGLAEDTAPVFTSRSHRHTHTDPHTGQRVTVTTAALSTTQIWRIVKAAARRAHLKSTMSPACPC